MFVALFVGACETIVGAALSTVVPAVKLKVEACTGVPLALVTALVTFTVYCDPEIEVTGWGDIDDLPTSDYRASSGSGKC